MNNPLNTRKEFASAEGGAKGHIYSLKALKEQGYTFVRVSDLIYHGNAYVDSQGEQKLN